MGYGGGSSSPEKWRSLEIRSSVSWVHFLKLVHFGRGEVIKGSLREERTSSTTMPRKVPPLKGHRNVSITDRVGTRCTQIFRSGSKPFAYRLCHALWEVVWLCCILPSFFPPHRLSLQRVTRLPYLDHSVKLTRYFLCSQTSIEGHTSPERIFKMCSISYQWMTVVAEEKSFHVNNVHASLSTVCRLFLSKRFYLTVLLSLVRLCMSIDKCMHTHQDLCNDRQLILPTKNMYQQNC